ncbi:NIF family HAD-type phosphatase [Halobacteriovorax sp. HLS]|uniref:NIF family HAD-type phosphatase n=1 Tax=Halobacteriovorax sp. HLS TaxID=2234000 RepID=UPI000FD819BB|nr:NIF family HAD-type phosphatase [Halobacteriovorax sp. HLS]
MLKLFMFSSFNDDNRAVKLYLFILIFMVASCASNSRVPAQLDPVDIVFDLDWTLIKQLKRGENLEGENIIHYQDEVYRLNDGAIELLEYLSSRPDVRISYYSGGQSARNIEVLKQINILKSNAYILAYKVLSREDLEVISTDESLAFTDRFKKNLKLVNSDLSSLVHIDDDIRFASNETQSRNFLWLQSVLYHIEQPDQVAMTKGPFDPKTKHARLFDKKKLFMVKDILQKSLESRKSNDFVDSVHKHSRQWNFKANKFEAAQARPFLKELRGSSCQDLIFNFLVVF